MLEIRELHKRFGDVIALNGCSFEVARGQILGFLGPNGAGKTTAMRSIFGLLKPDSGSTTWDGQPIGPAERARFGYMPEQRGLYPKMRISDQLIYLGRLHGMSTAEATTSAHAWLDRFELAERSEDRLETLSHGNQQRVQLASALVHDPQLLVLDEPFSGLDPIAVETMSGVLAEQAHEGKAVVFSSHQLDLVEDLCEEVAIINDGAVVVRGKVRELKDSAPIRHLEVDLDGDSAQLLHGLEGVKRIETRNGFHTVILDASTDVREFIARAERSGRLRHFSYTTPSLSDLFREAVR